VNRIMVGTDGSVAEQS